MKKYCLIGLGNVGNLYAQTYHNMGRLFVEFIAKKNKVLLIEIKKYEANIAKFQLDEILINLGVPNTMMNASGVSVNKVLKYEGILVENLILAYDDLDIPFGEFKLQFGKNPHAHNGVNSVISNLGTNEFWHLRIGIGVIRPDAFEGRDFVLSQIPKEQKKVVLELFENISNEMNKILKI